LAMDNQPLSKRFKLSMEQDASQPMSKQGNDLETNPDLDSLSQLEQLPCELLWMIVDYTPESVFALRETSRQIKSHVDKHVKKFALNAIVNKVIIRNKESTKMPTMIELTISVPDQGTKLIILCVILRNTSEYQIVKHAKNAHHDKIDEIFDAVIQKKWQGSRDITFSIRLDDNCIGGFLGRTLGLNITELYLYECNEKETLDAVSKLAEGTEIRHLKIKSSTLTKDSVNHLVNIIKSHNVKLLSISVEKCDAEIDFISILLDLASMLHSMHIQQTYVKGIPKRIPYFLGDKTNDWSATIIEMFKRKLDKLYIDSVYFNYLPFGGATVLKENLPKIGKKIWFAASCNAFGNGLKCTVNEHKVIADHLNIQGAKLAIRHLSRNQEKFDD
ncbi:hypothetical protein PENTCL1PPCAC_19124, partial [Pristionchus entomophagus]